MRTTISWLADRPFDAVGKISIFMCSAAPLDAFIRSRQQFTAVPVFLCRLTPESSVLFVFCSSICLWNIGWNVATVKLVRRAGVTMIMCIWHYQMSLSSQAHHIQNGLYFFFWQLQYSCWHFYIPTCLTALLSINQPLRRIKERLTAFGGQQTHMWPWLQSINAAIYARARQTAHGKRRCINL